MKSEKRENLRGGTTIHAESTSSVCKLKTDESEKDSIDGKPSYLFVSSESVRLITLNLEKDSKIQLT